MKPVAIVYTRVVFTCIQCSVCILFFFRGILVDALERLISDVLLGFVCRSEQEIEDMVYFLKCRKAIVTCAIVGLFGWL